MKAPIDREVKLAYVQQILTGKISASVAAKELGVHESSVYTGEKMPGRSRQCIARFR
jgi:hypothetical protein